MFLKIFKYGGTNGVAFIADTALLLTLDYMLDVRREYIAFFCYLCGSLVSYVLAKRFVFESGWLKKKPRFEFIAYLFGGLIGAIITAFIFALMASLGFNNILFQKVVSGVISFFTVFLYRNYIVFLW